MKIGILDYGAGNLRSVVNAFVAIGHEAELVRSPGQFANLDLLVFPGQGSFGDSVKQLQAANLWVPLKVWLEQKRPYFGICLGYQLLFEGSEESPGVEGLGVFRGQVRRFSKQAGFKIPHMGWNGVKFTNPENPAWAGMEVGETFYFVHSFYPQPEDRNLVACETDYMSPFASGIAAENLLAVQFHPEKSQQAGLRLLRNAVDCLVPLELRLPAMAVES
ncbi:imidazole glycerol phosphate synthase subunit HisH [Phragmitibacter flavus]|uniref:Imidazole glycerol phosphate synthase subunit HisH n=1 Tax=Phragmitibacter flavus TaxID=2576071 RepID=A0A5R8K7G1_9BACT|nr:imidazole glycerol phosphate synthase subunit HisH [Phragmitibacter flavus]